MFKLVVIKEWVLPSVENWQLCRQGNQEGNHLRPDKYPISV